MCFVLVFLWYRYTKPLISLEIGLISSLVSANFNEMMMMKMRNSSPKQKRKKEDKSTDRPSFWHLKDNQKNNNLKPLFFRFSSTTKNKHSGLDISTSPTANGGWFWCQVGKSRKLPAPNWWVKLLHTIYMLSLCWVTIYNNRFSWIVLHKLWLTLANSFFFQSVQIRAGEFLVGQTVLVVYFSTILKILASVEYGTTQI